MSGADRAALTDFDRKINERLNEMQTIVQPGDRNRVRWKISSYLKTDSELTEQMLGRMVQYFPLIEQKLKAANLPEDLKFLPVIESTLRPDAVSHAGATGMWQFMYYTGLENGLRINRAVDERRDPVAATDAAIKYLSALYKRFDDWTLALAAYNSGPGRVERAIRYSGSKNFWELMRYLPRETRNYIPKYLAAAYLCKHYRDHDLKPEWPSLDLQLTGQVKVHKTLSLRTVTEWTDLSYSELRTLNPAFRRGYIPASRSGYRLRLPERLIPLVEAKLNEEKSDTTVLSIEKSSYIKAEYKVRTGEDLDQIAQIFDLNPAHLKYWNDLTGEQVESGRELIMHLHSSKHNRWLIEERAGIEVDLLASVPLRTLNRSPVERPVEEIRSTPCTFGIISRQTITIHRGQSLRDIAIQQGFYEGEDWTQRIRTVDKRGAPPGSSLQIIPLD